MIPPQGSNPVGEMVEFDQFGTLIPAEVMLERSASRNGAQSPMIGCEVAMVKVYREVYRRDRDSRLIYPPPADEQACTWKMIPLPAALYPRGFESLVPLRQTNDLVIPRHRVSAAADLGCSSSEPEGNYQVVCLAER